MIRSYIWCFAVCYLFDCTYRYALNEESEQLKLKIIQTTLLGSSS